MTMIGTPGEGFRGLAPSGLREIARACSDRAARLDGAASETASVLLEHPGAVVGPLPRRLEYVAQRVAEWAADLTARATAIEHLESAASHVLLAIRDQLNGTAIDRAHQVVAPDRATIDPATAYRALDSLLLARDRGSKRRGDEITAIIDGMKPADVVVVVDGLLAGGHDLRGVARIGEAAAGLRPGALVDLLEAFSGRVAANDFGAVTFVGHLVGASRPEAAPFVASWLGAARGRTAAALRGAAVRAEVVGNTVPTINGVVDVLSELQDAGRIADVVVDLIAAQQDRRSGLDPDHIDRAIVAVIGVNPRAVVSRLASVADPDGSSMIQWMRHLLGAERGADHLAEVVDGVLGPERMDPVWFSDPGPDRTFRNAATAAYLATSLTLAVTLEARDAQHDVGVIASAATTAEILMPAVGGVTRAVEVLIPVGLSFGVGTTADRVNAQIGDAAAALVEQIAERFEPPPETSTESLARALDVFDEHRDELIRRWQRP